MVSPEVYFRTTCRMCLGRSLRKVLALTPTPPGNRFVAADELDKPETVYPLELYFCPDCHHLQLGHVVSPQILYQNSYSYVSSTAAEFVRHLQAYAAEMVGLFALAPGSLVVDIGSNDGTCLRFFAQAGMKVLGVDPAKEIAERATTSGIPTVPDFFSHELAVRLRGVHGPASFITSHNTCAHIDDLDGVIRGIRHWLADDGLFVLEVGYLLDVVEKAWFDTIYHEHLDYHTVEPFQRLFGRLGMKVIAAQRIAPQGGSIRVFAQKASGSKRPDDSVPSLIALERERGLNRPETFVEFGLRIDTVGTKLRTLIRALKAEGRSIAGYGAPTKATTLMAHFGLGRHELDFIVDDNPLKQGLFSPASHVPVTDASELYVRRPDYVVILAWNFAKLIMRTHERYANQGGRFILPMPEPRVA